MIYDNRNNNMERSEQEYAPSAASMRVCVSSHLRQGPGRRSLLAPEKLGAGMSSHTEAEMDSADALSRDAGNHHTVRRTKG